MKVDIADLEYRYSYTLLSAVIGPRPILLVSTVGEAGTFNTAPYALLTITSIKPAIVGFTVVRKRNGQKKDTLVNIEYSRDFVLSIVNENMAKPMNLTSEDLPGDVDEFKVAGLTPVKAELVKSPMVAESPVNMECRLYDIIELGKERIVSFILGEIIRVHINQEYLTDGAIDPLKLKVIGRLGGDFYCRTTDLFEMKGPHKEE
jgi:flavin reductase (DIM6/NTAB) family NADH-FMN oxidoreductase RutF